MSDKSEISRRLSALRERAGLSGQDVADALSKIRGKTVPKSSYTHYESSKFKQPALPLDLGRDLAAIFRNHGVSEHEVLDLAGITPQLLSTTSKEHQKPVDSATQPEVRLVKEPSRVLTEQNDLPVFGYVAGVGEDEVFFIDQGHEMTRTVRPYALRNVPDAYAVDVYGDSMKPRFEPGNRLWVHPRRPYKSGDDVVIQLDGERAIVKRVVRKTEKYLLVEQFNPVKQIKLAWSEIKQVDLVVGMVTIAT
jgi:phage repressor protein C with HTH and peptisase S24 domain